MSQLADAELKHWSFVSEDGRTPISISAEPALRWSYFDTGRYYGDLYIVTSQERPVAIFAMFRWFHPLVRSYVCATSLDDSRFVARRNGKPQWQPSTSSLQWQRLPEAPRPAGSGPYRLVQMRRIARDFSGEVLTLADKTNFKKLRLMPQPIHRYSAGDADGAIFAFANGTTPAVLLCVEADLSPKDTHWRYGIARRWSYESRIQHKSKEVWMAPTVRAPADSSDPYYVSVIPEQNDAD
ncbi:MAG: hypothetical protein AB8B91_06515, partial [Rubripirellula sp.]